ncbi:MAG: glycosyltransferase family 2 protein [Roseiflexaceae bacterium]
MLELVESPQTEVAPLPRRWDFSVSVIIPARNEAESIGKVIRGVLQICPSAEVIVVDDHSSDETPNRAEQAGARVIRRPYNIGNGAGVKTGIRAATGDVVVVLDADGQHNPADLPRLLDLIGPYDMVIGTRSRTGQQNTLRWLGNSLLNRLGSYVAGMPMEDLTSGFRAMRRSVMMEFVELLPNQFSWPTTSAMAFAKAGYHIRFEPIGVRPRTSGRSSQKLFKNFFKFLMIIFKIVSLFAPLRVYTPIALTMFALGLVSFLLGFFIGPEPFRLKIPGSAVVLFTGSLIVFMFGLLSEQIANLWFKGQNRDG